MIGERLAAIDEILDMDGDVAKRAGALSALKGHPAKNLRDTHVSSIAAIHIDQSSTNAEWNVIAVHWERMADSCFTRLASILRFYDPHGRRFMPLTPGSSLRFYGDIQTFNSHLRKRKRDRDIGERGEKGQKPTSGAKGSSRRKGPH